MNGRRGRIGLCMLEAACILSGLFLVGVPNAPGEDMFEEDMK